MSFFLILASLPVPSFNAKALDIVYNGGFNITSGDVRWFVVGGSYGQNVCGDNGITTTETVSTIGLFSSLGNPPPTSGFVSGRTKSETYRAALVRYFTIEGTGPANVKGYLDLLMSGSNWNAVNTSWIRLDVRSGDGTTFIGTLACYSANSSGGFFQIGGGSQSLALESGVAYRLLVTSRIQNGTTANSLNNIYWDNVELLQSPTGLLAAPDGSGATSTTLTWDQSMGTSTNPGLSYYSLFRDTSSPVASSTSNLVATTTDLSYTDTSAVGNTLYYYAMTDTDASSTDSVLSVESSTTTRPGKPTGLNFTSVGDNGMTVNWSAPAGGSPLYHIERCTGSGCSDFAEVGTESGTSFIDSGLSVGTVYTYRIRGKNVSGFGFYSVEAAQSTTGGGAVYSVSITPGGSIEYGFVALGTATSTVGTSYTKTATNDGTATEKLNVKSSNATGGTTWTLASAIGALDEFKHEFSTTTGSIWTTMPTVDTYVTAAPSVAQSGTVNFDFRLTVPSASSDYQQKSITITVQAVAP